MLRSVFLALPFVLAAALPAAAQDHDCVVRQFVMARNVASLEPVGLVDGSYPPDTERAYAFARLDCSQVGPGGETFWFIWMHGDREVARSKARVDISHNWRIWSQSRIFPGNWAVLLKDGEGRLQAEQRFTFAKPGDTAAVND
jgi:hypothetical protein